MLGDLNFHLADVATESAVASTMIVEAYLLAAAITMFCYDWLTVFVDELEFIWRKDFTLGKVIYIWMRIISMIYLSMCVLDVSNSRSLFFTIQTNIVPSLPWIYEVLSTLVLQSSLVIQSMRIHAIYGQQKWMKIFLTCLVLVSTTSSVILYTLFPFSTNTGSGRTIHTAQLKGFLGPQWLLIFALASESIVLALVLYKSWECRSIYRDLPSASTKDHLLSVMVSDSIKYYVAIFIVYAVTLAVAFLGPVKKSSSIPALGDSPIMFMSTGFSGILSPRLILNLRREYYGGTDPAGSQEGARTISWAAPGQQPTTFNSDLSEEVDDLESRGARSRT